MVFLPPYTQISLLLPPLVSDQVGSIIIGTCYIHPTEKKVEELLILEAKYGPISGYEPAINDVFKYVAEVLACRFHFEHYTQLLATFIVYFQLIGSTNEQDKGMKIKLYFMLSIEGSAQSQIVRTSNKHA